MLEGGARDGETRDASIISSKEDTALGALAFSHKTLYSFVSVRGNMSTKVAQNVWAREMQDPIKFT